MRKKCLNHVILLGINTSWITSRANLGSANKLMVTVSMVSRYFSYIAQRILFGKPNLLKSEAERLRTNKREATNYYRRPLDRGSTLSQMVTLILMFSRSDGFSIDSLYHLCYNYNRVVYLHESYQDPHSRTVLNSIKKVRKGI